MVDDIVLILFGGSGSEIEVCKILNRRYVSAEIDEKYYKMILDRLSKGRIEEKYRLRSERYEVKSKEAQLVLLEERGDYLAGEVRKSTPFFK